MEGGQGGKFAPPQYFLYLRIVFFGYCAEEGQIKNGVTVGEKRCMCIKDWFKPIFPLLT
jgi:hypothetical protein